MAEVICQRVVVLYDGDSPELANSVEVEEVLAPVVQGWQNRRSWRHAFRIHVNRPPQQRDTPARCL